MEPGYYWIRFKGSYEAWQPAELSIDGYWSIIASDADFHPDSFVVGPRLAPPSSER